MSDEQKRLEALYGYRILDIPPEETFDDFVAMASDACGMPTAALTFIDSDCMWVKAICGRNLRAVGKSVSFADYVVRQGKTTVIYDALEHEELRSHPLVLSGKKIRFFAGTPLTTPDGFHVGAICVMDSVPCVFTPNQITALERIARHTVQILESRKTHENERTQHEAILER